MTHRRTRLAHAFVLLPTALCVSGVVVAVQHDGSALGVRPVADASPSALPLPTAPSALVIPGPTVAPAAPVLSDGASVTRVSRAATVPGTGALVPTAARRAAGADAPATAADSVSGIGTTALAAYQRAAAVIDQADPACRLDWTLLAAIGAVESGHGTYGGSTLDETGVATPAIEGPVLDGRHHTRRIADTDGGRLDHDTRFDRALGPMQILPATWLQIAIDADGDGRRDPQDINDAALAAAVYLCTGDADLSTPAGARSAVLRYNRSETYADTVLGLASGYQQDTAVRASVAGLVTSGGAVVSAVDAHPVATQVPAHHQATRHHQAAHQIKQHAVAGHGLKHHAVAQPVAPPAPAPSAPAPTVPAPTAAPKPPVATPAPPTESPTPAPTPTREDECRQAIVAAYPSADPDAVTAAVSACVDGLAGLSDDQAQAALRDLVAGLPATVPDLSPASAPASPAPLG